MNDQINIQYKSLEDAAEALQRLKIKLDAHKMYTDQFHNSQGKTRQAIGDLTDEFNQMKTTVGCLIDGTRIAFIETSVQFWAVDMQASTRIMLSSLSDIFKV